MSPLTEPTKLTLAKSFTQQAYMWEFPQQHGLWYPGLISTALWLDAADASTVTTVNGAVSQWNDKSGNANHFTQATAANRPAYSPTGFNNLPSITFDGVNDSLGFGARLATANRWVLLVTRFAAANVVNVPFCSSTTGSGANDADNVRFLTIDTKAGFGGPAGAGDSFVNPYSANTPYIFNWPQTVNGNLRTNGATVATGTPDKDVASFAVNTTQLGTDGYNNFLNGNLQEIIITFSVPSLATVEKIEGYVAHKWGLTANLPAGHPYKTVGPTP